MKGIYRHQEEDMLLHMKPSTTSTTGNWRRSQVEIELSAMKPSIHKKDFVLVVRAQPNEFIWCRFLIILIPPQMDR